MWSTVHQISKVKLGPMRQWLTFLHVGHQEAVDSSTLAIRRSRHSCSETHLNHLNLQLLQYLYKHLLPDVLYTIGKFVDPNFDKGNLQSIFCVLCTKIRLLEDGPRFTVQVQDTAWWQEDDCWFILSTSCKLIWIHLQYSLRFRM